MIGLSQILSNKTTSVANNRIILPVIHINSEHNKILIKLNIQILQTFINEQELRRKIRPGSNCVDDVHVDGVRLRL
jgi:predicted glycosyltransferase involved in capsule biosynthesis